MHVLAAQDDTLSRGGRDVAGDIRIDSIAIHKCHVVFTDEAVGELQYTIIGKAELPEILDTFQADCNSEESYSFKKVLNFKNDKLEQARN